MLDGKKLEDAHSKLTGITKDLSWIDINNDANSHEFSTLAIKSLILQVKDVERVLTELVEEPEV